MYPPRNPMVSIFDKGWSNKKIIFIMLGILFVSIASAIPAIIWGG